METAFPKYPVDGLTYRAKDVRAVTRTQTAAQGKAKLKATAAPRGVTMVLSVCVLQYVRAVHQWMEQKRIKVLFFTFKC